MLCDKRKNTVLYKKATITAVDVKLEYATRKRAAKVNALNFKPTKMDKVGNGIFILNNTSLNKLNSMTNKICIVSTLLNIIIIRSPKKKSDRLLKVGKTKINIPFKNNSDKYITPPMSTEIQSNINKKYERQINSSN